MRGGFFVQAALSCVWSAACAQPPQRSPRQAPPPILVAPAPDQANRESAPPRSLSEPRCFVRGDGDRVMDEDLVLYGAPDRTTPLVVVRWGQGVALAWSELGRLAAEEGRVGLARARIGGQGMARVEGYATLSANALRLREDTTVVPGHVFLRAGDAVDRVRGEVGERLSITESTTLTEPSAIQADVPCSGLRWGFVASAPFKPPPRHFVVKNPQLDLYDAPSGKRVLYLVFPGEQQIGGSEPKDGFVEVEVEARALFRGYAREDDLSVPPVAHSRLGGSHRKKPPYIRSLAHTAKIATVAFDTPLLVGDESQDEVGTVEQGAVLRLGKARGELVSFIFDSDAVMPPPGKRFFVRAASLENLREEPRGGLSNQVKVPTVDEGSVP